MHRDRESRTNWLCVTGLIGDTVNAFCDKNETERIQNRIGRIHAYKTVVNVRLKSMTGAFIKVLGRREWKRYCYFYAVRDKYATNNNIFKIKPKLNLDYCPEEARDLKIDYRLSKFHLVWWD